jgi:hypothetical protein
LLNWRTFSSIYGAIIRDMKTLAELSQALRVAERLLACTDPKNPALALIRRTIVRDCLPLSFGGKS